MLTDRPAESREFPPAPGGGEPRAPRRRPGGRLIVLGVLLALVAGAAAALIGGAGGSGTAERADAGGERPSAVEERPAAKDPDAVDPLAPLPKARPRVVEPVAGETSLDGGQDAPASAERGGERGDDSSLPEPKGPATDSGGAAKGSGGVSGLRPDRATALPNGIALPPLEAPEAVLNVIRAGNIIARSPYKWGGGHGRFKDNGYDCSGSVSYALYFAGLLDKSYTSGQLMGYGKPGKGRWITLYANAGHVYMEVAGIRFDTSGARGTGSRWQNDLRPTGGYAVRHPPGL